MKKFTLPLLSLPVVALLITLDQWTKRWAEAELAGKGIVSVIGDFFVFNFAQNHGAFLSLGNNLGDALWVPGMIILPLVALALFTGYVLWKKPTVPAYWILWCLVFSGGLGNLIDRVLVGKVTDFMNMGFGPVIRTGIFNLADVYIMIALAFILLFSGQFSSKKNPKPEPKI